MHVPVCEQSGREDAVQQSSSATQRCSGLAATEAPSPQGTPSCVHQGEGEAEQPGTWQVCGANLQDCCGLEDENEGGSDTSTRFGPLKCLVQGISAQQRLPLQTVAAQILAILKQPGGGSSNTMLEKLGTQGVEDARRHMSKILDPQGSKGVWVESLREAYANRQPDTLLHTAYMAPCASAYVFTFLTAVFQEFLRGNECLSTTQSCVRLRDKTTKAYLAVAFKVEKNRNVQDYGNKTGVAMGLPAVDPTLAAKMATHKGKSLGTGQKKAETILASLQSILPYLCENDALLSDADKAVAVRLEQFVKQADETQLAAMIDQFDKLQAFSVQLEDDFWFRRSFLGARGHALVLEAHRYASERGLQFQQCLEPSHLLAIRSRFFSDKLPETESHLVVNRMCEVLVGQAGTDGQSKRADTARSAAGYAHSNMRKMVWCAHNMKALMENGCIAFQADGKLSDLWGEMSTIDRQEWETQHGLKDKIDRLMDQEAFDQFVEQHKATLGGQFARQAVQKARTCLKTKMVSQFLHLDIYMFRRLASMSAGVCVHSRVHVRVRE